MNKPVELTILMRDKTRQGIESASQNVDGLTHDYDELIRAIRESNTEMENSGKSAQSMAGGFGNMQSMLLKLGGTTALVGLGREIINVRGEIQMMEKSFEVLTGSEAKAASVLAELKDIAIKSPLSLTDVSNGAQMLMAFNVEAGKAVDVVKQISDISMGDSQKFQSLLLAYSQMSSLGKVISQDVRQMATAGFNPLVEIARTTGRSIEDLSKALSDGAITVDMVKGAFISATSEGGKFYRMTEKQAEGLAGLKASLGDAWMNMLNEIGQGNNDLIAGGYKLTTSLVQNYETVGKAVMALVATYGAYKTAVVLNTVAEKGWTISQIVNYNWLLLVEKAQKLLNKTMLSNPYVLIATLIVGVVTAMWALHDSTTAEEKAQKKLNDTLEAAKTKKQNLKTKAHELIGILQDETQTIYEQVKAYEALMKVMPSSLKGMTFEQVKALTPDEFAKIVNQASGNTEYATVKKMYDEAQKNVDRLKKSIAEIATIPNAGGALMEARKELKEAIAEQDVAAKQLNEINRLRKEAKEQEEKDKSKPITKNKEYWEQQKKTAETARAALDSQEKNSADWEKYSNQIADAQKEIDKYSDSKERQSEKAGESAAAKAARDAQQQADANTKLINSDVKAALERRQTAIDNDQKLLDIEKDGYVKRQKQIELDHQKELLNIDKHAQELLEKEQEAARLAWEKEGKNGKFTAPTVLSEENQGLIDTQTKTQNETKKAETKKLIQELSTQYADYAQKRLDIEKKFNEDLDAMYDVNGDLLIGVTQANVDELKRQSTEALATLDNEFSRTTTSIEKLFGDMSRKSVADMRGIADQAQAMMEFITGGNWDAGKAASFGIQTEAQFKQLNAEWANSPEKLAAIKKAIQDLNDEADQSETAFNKMSNGLKKVFSSGSNQKNLKDGLSLISDGLQSATKMGDMFADSLRNIGELSGNETFGQIADGISSVMDAANKTMEGAQAGAAFGPVGAAIGAALGLVSSITGALAAGREQARRNAELTKQMINQQFIGEKDVNRLYRERYEWSQKIGETQLDYIKRVGEELKKQRAESEKDTADYWNKLQNSQYYTRWDSGKRSGIFGDWSAKDVDAHWTGETSLNGKTEKEIEELYYQGKLTDDAKAWYELYLKAKEEQGDLLQKEAEEMDRIRELYTGTSYEGIVNSIVEGFKAGKRSAVDFADTFQELMQGAMASALQLAADEKTRKFYEEFAGRSNDADGLTQSDIEYLNNLWDSIINSLSEETENLQKATGIAFGGSSQSGKAGAFETMTQDQGTKLEGLFTSVQNHTSSIDDRVTDISSVMYSVSDTLLRIEENTSYCRKLEEISEDIAAIKRDGLKIK
jgi:tape measure domain-containing protein